MKEPLCHPQVESGRVRVLPRTLLRGLWALLALVALALVLEAAGCGSRRTLAQAGGQTLVGYQHTGTPPWPAGNCFSAVRSSAWSRWLARLWNTSWWRGHFSRFGGGTGWDPGWTVVNMHAENLREITRQLNITSFEVERVNDRFCLVVDRRIPREWLLSTPKACCAPLALRQKLWQQRPECFRDDPSLQSLCTSTWVRTDLHDPAGRLERLLPGEQIRFEPAQLTCASAGGVALAQRYWQPHERWGTSRPEFIQVIEVQPSGYSGMGLQLDRVGDLLRLTARSLVQADPTGTRTESLPDDEAQLARATYRREDALPGADWAGGSVFDPVRDAR